MDNPSTEGVKPTFEKLLTGAKVENAKGRGAVNCNYTLAAQGKLYPRTCRRCGLGPCAFQDTLLAASLPSPPMSEAGEDEALRETLKETRSLTSHWISRHADLCAEVARMQQSLSTAQQVSQANDQRAKTAERALIVAQGEIERLRAAIAPLIEQWKSYLKSYLNYECAHNLLARYELWERLDDTLNPPAPQEGR